MKMTMHIDDALLERAMALAGIESKTAAVDMALREFVRRGALVKELTTGLDLSPAELKEVFEPGYDLEAMRLAETPASYGRKSRARR
jgi:hypothetical protein